MTQNASLVDILKNPDTKRIDSHEVARELQRLQVKADVLGVRRLRKALAFFFDTSDMKEVDKSMYSAAVIADRLRASKYKAATGHLEFGLRPHERNGQVAIFYLKVSGYNPQDSEPFQIRI